jgi:hypothetical protein
LSGVIRASPIAVLRKDKTAIEDGNLPAAQIANAQLKAFEAHSEMTEVTRRRPFVVMPTGAKGARRLAALPRKDLQHSAPQIACGADGKRNRHGLRLMPDD